MGGGYPLYSFYSHRSATEPNDNVFSVQDEHVYAYAALHVQIFTPTLDMSS